MSQNEFRLESSSVTYTVGFQQGNIYCQLFRKIAECRLDQITKVILKRSSIGMGDEYSFRLFYNENGKEKKFPWIQVLYTSSDGELFFKELRDRLGSHVIWQDTRNDISVDESGAKIFDMQYLPMSYSGAGLTRGTQLWIYTIIFGLFILPLIYYVKILAKGGYRIYAGDSELEIRKFGSKKIAWNDISDITFQKITVRNQSFQSNDVVKVCVQPKSGRKIKFVMRYDQLIPFMKELVVKGIIEEGVVV